MWPSLAVALPTFVGLLVNISLRAGGDVPARQRLDRWAVFVFVL